MYGDGGSRSLAKEISVLENKERAKTHLGRRCAVLAASHPNIPLPPLHLLIFLHARHLPSSQSLSSFTEDRDIVGCPVCMRLPSICGYGCTGIRHGQSRMPSPRRGCRPR